VAQGGVLEHQGVVGPDPAERTPFIDLVTAAHLRRENVLPVAGPLTIRFRLATVESIG
jgi:hypothetical protein